MILKGHFKVTYWNRMASYYFFLNGNCGLKRLHFLHIRLKHKLTLKSELEVMQSH